MMTIRLRTAKSVCARDMRLDFFSSSLLCALQRLHVTDIDLAETDCSQSQTDPPDLLAERRDDADLLGLNHSVRGLVDGRSDESEDVISHRLYLELVEEGRALVDLEVVACDVLKDHREARVRELRPSAQGAGEKRSAANDISEGH